MDPVLPVSMDMISSISVTPCNTLTVTTCNNTVTPNVTVSNNQNSQTIVNQILNSMESGCVQGGTNSEGGVQGGTNNEVQGVSNNDGQGVSHKSLVKPMSQVEIAQVASQVIGNTTLNQICICYVLHIRN